MDAARPSRNTVRLAAWGLVAAIVAIATIAVGPPGLALAKPAASAPVPSLDIEVWPDHQQGLSTLIVLARLPQGTRLPATVLMPLPTGAQVTWSGEIDENSASGDTTVPATYPALPGGGRAIQITATKFPAVQYEAVLGPVTRQDGRVTTKLDWVQTVPASLVTFATRAPIDATNVILNPAAAGEPQTDTSLGQKLYTLEPRKPAVGASIPFTVSYTVVGGGSGGAAAQATDASGRALPWFLAFAAAIFVAMGLMVWSSRRRSAMEPAEEDGEDEEDED
jgi:hypothetical protein